MEASALSIHPNPNSGIFTVNGLGMNAQITITSAIGEVIVKTNALQYEAAFDISKYPNGIYFIEMVSPQNTVTQKIIVNH
jgi:formylmethanofuran dehydrogenase subunit D